MTRVYGCSDDLVEIEDAPYPYDEVGCFDSNVRIWFDDGTIVLVSYGKDNLGIWNIEIEEEGTSKLYLNICNDENAEIYSDILEIEANFMKCEVIHK